MFLKVAESEEIYEKACVFRLMGGWTSNNGDNDREQPEPSRRKV